MRTPYLINFDFNNIYRKVDGEFEPYKKKRKIQNQIDHLEGIVDDIKDSIMDELAYDFTELLTELDSLIKIKGLSINDIDNELLNRITNNELVISLFKEMEVAIMNHELCLKCAGRGGYSVSDIIDHSWETCDNCNGTGKGSITTILQLYDIGGYDYGDFVATYFYYKGKIKC